MPKHKDQPDFNDPKSWYEAGILRLERQTWMGSTDCSVRSYVCPLCQGIVTNPDEHIKWHEKVKWFV